MNDRTSKFKSVILWPEFRAAWILAVIVIIALALDVTVLTSWVVWAEAALLIIVLAMVFAAIYHSAQADRGASTERNELKSILQSLEDALIVYEPDFRVTFFNPSAERLFKIEAKAITGHVLSPSDVETPGWRTLVQVIFPSLAPRVLPRTKEGEYPQVADLSFTDPVFEFRVTSSPIVDESGRTLAFMKIIRDRTSQITALKSRSEFITVASHQLRGPVTDINWALQSLGGSSELGETNKMIVENALLASGGLLRRIEDLLNIAKMEDGQFGYQFEDTDMVDFVGKVLADVLPAARKASVKIYFDRPAQSMPHVMIDSKRLSLAFVNLLENAIRYNVQNGEVTVKIDQMAGKPFIEMSVKDTGIGVPPEAIEKLFNKFYRADNAMKAQTEGSGLGLYIAKGIIQAHGGQIWAESELNRGTTITFSLPTDPDLVPHKEVNSGDFF